MMIPKPTRLTKIVRKMMRSGRVTTPEAIVYGSLRDAACPRAEVVANGDVIQIRQAPAGLVDELRDPSQFRKLNLRYLVRVGMIVRMQSRREEDNRDALGGVAVMIAPEVQLLEIVRIVELVIERERL